MNALSIEPPASPYLTRTQAADYLNVSVRWLANGGRAVVPSLRFSGQVRYDVRELDRWARQQSAHA